MPSMDPMAAPKRPMTRLVSAAEDVPRSSRRLTRLSTAALHSCAWGDRLEAGKMEAE